MDRMVRGRPDPRVKLLKSILELLVKVKGRLESRPTGLRLSSSSTEPYGIFSGTTVKRPVDQTGVSCQTEHILTA